MSRQIITLTCYTGRQMGVEALAAGQRGSLWENGQLGWCAGQAMDR
jgi:hypothetical protein